MKSDVFCLLVYIFRRTDIVWTESSPHIKKGRYLLWFSFNTVILWNGLHELCIVNKYVNLWWLWFFCPVNRRSNGWIKKKKSSLVLLCTMPFIRFTNFYIYLFWHRSRTLTAVLRLFQWTALTPITLSGSPIHQFGQAAAALPCCQSTCDRPCVWFLFLMRALVARYMIL